LRVEFSGATCHIAHRGNGKKRIFTDDHNRERFLLRKLFKVLAEDEALKRTVENISEKLNNERRNDAASLFLKFGVIFI
jgi:nitrogen regulatory protein PII